MDKGAIRNFQATCGDITVKEMFCHAKSFQRDAVRRYNPDADEPIHSNHSGLIDIDEGASKECGALALDLLIKFGIMMKSKDGSYDVFPDSEAKKAYLFVISVKMKTVKLCTKLNRVQKQSRRSKCCTK